MPHRQMLAGSFASNLEMVKMTVADFSDADMLCRPVPRANHALWQLGHVILSETGLVSRVSPGAMPTLPDGFDRQFGHEMAACDDASKFPTKHEILDLLTTVRHATIDWVKAIRPADLDCPLPETISERLRRKCPTVGNLAMLIPTHTTMHIGQIQVIRRALGKPVLY